MYVAPYPTIASNSKRRDNKQLAYEGPKTKHNATGKYNRNCGIVINAHTPLLWTYAEDVEEEGENMHRNNSTLTQTVWNNKHDALGRICICTKKKYNIYFFAFVWHIEWILLGKNTIISLSTQEEGYGCLIFFPSFFPLLFFFVQFLGLLSVCDRVCLALFLFINISIGALTLFTASIMISARTRKPNVICIFSFFPNHFVSTEPLHGSHTKWLLLSFRVRLVYEKNK